MVSNLTCGVLVPMRVRIKVDQDIDQVYIPPNFCGGNAVFRYEGLVTIGANETKEEAIALRGRNTLDLCLDHSRQMFSRMEPALKDGKATMRCLVQDRQTIRCGKCQSTFRFEPLQPTMHKAPGRYCPHCGAQAVTTVDPQLDYWELIVQQLPGELPPYLAARIHSLWIADRTSTAQFIDYVTQIYGELE